MKKLFIKALNLRKKYCNNNWDCDKVVNILCKKYVNIPRDIIKWFIVRHCNQGEQILRGLKNINAKKIKIIKSIITNDEILNINTIDYAPFAKNDDDLKSIEIHNEDWYKYYYLVNGTWSAPIIAVKEGPILYVIDGTMRFRHMKIALYNKLKFLMKSHYIYIISNDN